MQKLQYLVALILIEATCLAAPDMESRLSALEQQNAKLQSKIDLLEGRSTAVQVSGKEDKLSIGGFVHLNGEVGSAPDSRYAGINNRVMLRRARITTKGYFGEGFEFVLQPDFGNNSISGNTAYRAGLADAYVTWTKYSYANIQVGQFKSAFGYEQLMADTKVPTVERSLPNDMLTVSRQIGVALNGSVLDKYLNYTVGVYNGNGANNGFNDNDQFMYAGRVSAVAWKQGSNSVTFGTNGYWSNDTGSFTGRRTAFGFDSQLIYQRFNVDAEYLHVLQNRQVGVDGTADGWSILAGYYFVPKKLQGILRYETYDSNTRVSGNESENWVFGFNYFVKGDDIKLGLNYMLGNPAGPLNREGRILARVQVIF